MVHVSMYAYVYVRCRCRSTCRCRCRCVHRCRCTCMCMWMCMWMCMSACLHVCMYVHMFMYKYIYMYIWARRHSPPLHFSIFGSAPNTKDVLTLVMPHTAKCGINPYISIHMTEIRHIHGPDCIKYEHV